MKNLKLFLLGWMAVMTLAQVGCSSEDQLSGTENARKPLNVNIHSGLYTRGGVISSSYLPNASVVGLFLQKEDGTRYDNLPYNNIPYVATGTGATQTWAPQSAEKQILLSATEGKAYAYYPYKAENTSFSSIHLDASRQDDVMYTSTASTGLNDKNADASFELQHALAVMKVKVKRGSYTGAGNVTSCSISGSPIGLTGKLDGTTGKLSGVTTGTVSVNKSYKISTTATDHDIIFVPTTTAGQVTVGLTMDGKEYTTTTSSSETFQPNQCYTLNLTVDDSGATLSGIHVGNWSMSGEGNSIVTAGGYEITFDGDYSDIALNVNVDGGGSSVTVQAISISSSEVPPHYVTTTSNCSIAQSWDKNLRTIELTNLTGNVTLTFYGIGATWVDAKQKDGVYGIKSDGNPMLYSEVSTSSETLSGVAIVMYGRAMQISHNQLTSLWTTMWSNTVDIELLPNLTVAGGGVTVAGYSGTLPYPDGSYKSSANHITPDHTTWLNYPNTALADTTGWTNTEIIIAAQPKTTIGPNVKAFREGTLSISNQGFSDWFVPSAGQLAFMFMNMEKINTLLAKCSNPAGTALPKNYHWSSSEYGEDYAWYVNFVNGIFGHYQKNSIEVDCYVRFLRDFQE